MKRMMSTHANALLLAVTLVAVPLAAVAAPGLAAAETPFGPSRAAVELALRIQAADRDDTRGIPDAAPGLVSSARVLLAGYLEALIAF